MNKTFTGFKYLLLLSFFMLPCVVFAHEGSTRGNISNSQSGKPLEGVSIYIKELRRSAVTNGFGQFMIMNLQPGDYNISVTHVGFESIEMSLHIDDGVTTDLNIVMNIISANLQEITINSEKPQSLTTISDIDIKLRPINSSQDMMRMIPGLFTSQHQGGGKAEQMFLRGFDIDHGTDINVSVDDMPVNMVSHAHGQGYADLHFLIPELVQTLNFGKGPYQIDKGDFATAGFAAFKTYDYLDNSFVKLEGGMYDHFRTVAAIDLLNSSKGSGKNSAYIAGDYTYNKGYFDAPQHFNRLNLMGKFSSQLSENKRLNITLSAFGSQWDASGQIPERAVEEGLIGRFGQLDQETGKTSRYNLNIEYLQSVNASSIFKSNAYVSYYDFDLISDFTFFLKDPVNGDRIRQKEQRLLTGYNAKYTTDYHLGNLKTTTEVGAGFRHDDVSNDELSHVDANYQLLDRLAFGDVHETSIFGYANQTVYLLPQLVLNAGARLDYFVNEYKNKMPDDISLQSYTVAKVSPKLGLYYNFNNSARIYFNYGSGFHSNDTRVVVAQKGNNILPNANGYDLGVVLKPLPKLLFSGALWMLDLQSEFVYVGDEAEVEPSGRSRRMGFETSLRYEVFKWLYLDGDFNYTHARFIDEMKGNDFVPLAAKVTAIGGVTFKKDKWTTSLRFRHLGNRPANEDNTVIAKGYAVFDAVLSYRIRKFEFGAQIENLFNTKWNEAQFDTESRLQNEAMPVSEIHFTPGTPFAFKLTAMVSF
jgi:hypothetical protein